MSQVVHATDANFEVEVMQAEGPVLVDFSAGWCAPCKKLEPIVHEIADEFGPNAHVVKANVAKMPAAAHRFKIRSTPTFVLVSTTDRQRKKNKPNGNKPVPTQRWRASGLVQKDQLRRVLEREGARAVEA